MKPTAQLQQSQSTQLSAQVLQSIRLLQLNAQELELEVQQALAHNPLLEREEVEHEAMPESRDSSEVAAFDELPEPLAYATNFQGFDPSEAEDRLAAIAQPDSTDPYQRVLEALSLELQPRDLHVAAFWLEHCDDAGYLQGELTTLQREATARFHLRRGRAEAIRQRLLHGTPAGLCAVDLRECLLAQVADLPADEPLLPVLRRLITEGLELAAVKAWQTLAQRFGVDEECVLAAVRVMRLLDPKPAERFSARADEVTLPDVVVWLGGGQWQVALNPLTAPKLRVVEDYTAGLMAAPDAPGARQMRDLLNEARWLARGIAQRHDTLLRTTRAIVARQKGFLERGDEAMAPLTLKEIAAEIGMHESTISRVTTGKYLQTPRGLIELKHFFGTRLDGAAVAGTAIRAMVKRLIDAEPAGAPLADDAIAHLLAGRGVAVARRTVAKYREQLEIPSARERARPGCVARAA